MRKARPFVAGPGVQSAIGVAQIYLTRVTRRRPLCELHPPPLLGDYPLRIVTSPFSNGGSAEAFSQPQQAVVAAER